MVWWCNMGTIGDKLTYLEEAKTAIKNAIIEKGVEVSESIEFREYANKIKEIQGTSSDNIFQAIKFDVKSSDLENIQTYYTEDRMNIIKIAYYSIPFPVTINDMVFNSYSEIAEQFGLSNILFTTRFNGPSVYMLKSISVSNSPVRFLAWDDDFRDFELYMLIKAN